MAATIVKLLRTAEDQPLLHSCARLLAAGELAIVPMETVYGVLARLDHPNALNRLRELRNHNHSKAMTIHLGRSADALAYIDPPDDYAQHLMRKLWPAPVALMFTVSEARQNAVAQSLGILRDDLYEGNTITLRCPAHGSARQILAACPHPVVGAAAPGSPGSVDQMAQELLSKVEIVIDDGEAHYGKPSTIVRIGSGRFDIVRSGVYDRRIIEKMLRTNILFVCSGNTCRSPMAEGIARKVLSEHLKVSEGKLEQAGYTVMSAGAMALPGSPATDHAIDAARDYGADLSRHRSRALSPELINQADAIFAMGRSHAEAVRAMVPSARDKVTTLDPQGDIDDPIGGDVELYQTLAAHIRQVIESRLADRSLFGSENTK